MERAYKGSTSSLMLLLESLLEDLDSPDLKCDFSPLIYQLLKRHLEVKSLDSYLFSNVLCHFLNEETVRNMPMKDMIDLVVVPYTEIGTEHIIDCLNNKAATDISASDIVALLAKKTWSAHDFVSILRFVDINNLQTTDRIILRETLSKSGIKLKDIRCHLELYRHYYGKVKAKDLKQLTKTLYEKERSYAKE